jgi:hypothetical protein
MEKVPKFEFINNPRVEASNADAVVCHRVSDLPIPHVPAQIEQCRDCGKRIWVAHSSPRQPPRISWQCLPSPDKLDDDATFMLRST